MWLEQSFRRSYCFYAFYHQERINKLVHLFCVWPILATSMYLLAQTPALIEIDGKTESHGIEFDYAFFVAMIYIIFFLVIEQPGICGVSAALLVTIILKYSNEWQGLYTWQMATGVNVSCWIAQFYSHLFHEGKSPALLDNLVQAFMFAPLFVMLEVFFMFGYKKDLEKSVTKEVEKMNITKDSGSISSRTRRSKKNS